MCECRTWPACQPRLSGYGGRAKRAIQEGAVITKRYAQEKLTVAF